MSWLLLHCVATTWMVGVIWMVQLVHYPMFRDLLGLDAGAFHRAMAAHVRSMTWVVGPAMLIEVATAWAVWGSVAGRVSVGLLGLVWLSTASLQVPAHKRLAQSADAQTVDRLVRGNWLRTAGWSARGLLLVWIIAADAAHVSV